MNYVFTYFGFFFQELNKRQSQLESAHTMLMRHHEQTHDLEMKQQRSVHHLREDHLNRQHSTELSNQEEYMKRAQRELKKKHALEIKQQPKSLKQKELMIRKQFRDTCKIQTRQYKALKAQVLQSTSKEEQKTIIRKLKEEQRRKMALLGEQYEQTIADMLQKQSVSSITMLLTMFFLWFSSFDVQLAESDGKHYFSSRSNGSKKKRELLSWMCQMIFIVDTYE